MRFLPGFTLKLSMALIVVLLFSSWQSPILAQGGGAPILVVVNNGYAGNPFGNYLGEILRAEGLNAFDVIDIGSLTATDLTDHDLTILAETPLSSAQATMLNTYVTGGGRLIAMRPAAQITGLFGLTGSSAGTLNDGYVKINTAVTLNGTAPGQGLTGETLQIHGATDQYATAGGAVVLAQLYSNATTATSYPAVVSGSSGRAVAFTYDLVKNVVYTRQGNPANADVDIDGDGVLRTIDLFQTSGGGAPWVDRNKIPIPQADVQQRLLARLVQQLVGLAKPLPRLWYFPGTVKTVLISTGDAHANPTEWFQDQIDDLNVRGGKMTYYLSIGQDPSNSSVQAWRAQGHEFGIHPYAYKEDNYEPFNITSLVEGYQKYTAWYNDTFSSDPSRTVRNHQVAWKGWTQSAEYAQTYGYAMDVNFYHWGGWLQKPDSTWPHGYITGSGQPMRFIRADGTILDVYQQLTQLVDEQMVGAETFESLDPSEAVAVSQQLINASQAGDYAALMTQFHVDYYGSGGAEWLQGTLDYANSQGVPLWNADQWLRFTETRHDADYTDVAWNSSTKTLSFNLSAAASGANLTTLLPLSYGGNNLQSVTVDGSPVVHTIQTIHGVNTAFVTTPAGNHSFIAVYGTSGAVMITESGGSTLVSESGATDTYQIVLLTQPTHNVQISFTTDSQLNPIASRTFTIANWSTPQTVTVSAVDDTLFEGPHSSTIAHTVTSTDPAYNGLVVPSVFVSINDNDAPGVTIIESGGSTLVSESGATDTYQVVLVTPPTQNVQISFTTDSQLNPIASRTFTTANWFTPQTVTVSAVDDALVEGTHSSTIVHTVTSLDPNYNGVSVPSLTVSITDNDATGGLHTTVADFDQVCAVLDNSWVSDRDGGTILLAGQLFDHFTNPPLNAALWSAGNWDGSNTPAVASSILTVPTEVWVRSNATYTYGTVEAIAEFGAGASQHIGFANQDFAGNIYFIFSTFGGDGNLYARVNNNSSEQNINLGAIPTGLHRYRIEWQPLDATNDRVLFYLDNVLVEEFFVEIGASDLHLYLSNDGAASLKVDMAQVTPPHRAGGSYTSCVLDANNLGPGRKWGTISWDALVPASTVLTVQARTSSDGSTWNAWTTVATSGGNLAQTNRYAQYKLLLTTTNDQASPLVDWVALSLALPELSISDVSVTEGNSGPVNAVFTVSLSEPSTEQVTVNYATADGTATAPGDYTAASGTLTFAPGVTQRPITITVQGDLLDEPNETFQVNLSGASNATITDAQGIGTILDDDGQPTLSINDVSVTEGNSGPKNAVFTVSLSSASSQQVTVNYATADGTATAPGDYTAASGSLTFAAGVTTQQITVTVNGDTVYEANETFNVNLSNAVNAAISDGQGVGTILNDDINQAPVANAGPDQTVQAGALVTLNGSSSSDPDGHTPLTYGWQQTGGSAVSLSNPAISQPTFTAPGLSGAVTFTLVVTDTWGQPSAPDTIVVTVESGNNVYLPIVIK